MPYDSRVIRELLIEAYDDEALTGLCFDYFRPVYQKFTQGMTRPQKVQLLLEYTSQQSGGQDVLLQLVQQDNPAQFARYEPRLQVLAGPLLADITAPYRGLEAFYEEHAHLFFGREVLTGRLREKLHESRFLAVIGPSGSGKSSVVRAGLLPLLRRKGWAILTIRPGGHPLESLARCVTRELRGADDVQGALDLRQALGDNVEALHMAACMALDDLDGKKLSPHVVLLVDQFEEVFALCQDTAERQQFIANLLHAVAVAGGPLVVIPTMRADFYGRCAFYRDLAEQLVEHQMLVSPMSEEELRGAIEKPAQGRGFSFEAGLVDKLVEEVLGEEGALPLLQHALLELWARRDEERRLITAAAYIAMDGVCGAIAHRTEEVYNRITEGGQVTEKERPEEQRECIKRIMLRLVTPGEGTEDTRRRARLDEFGSVEEAELIQEMANARLLTTGRDPETDEETVDVAHEALIPGWPRLQEWIDEDRANLRIHRRLTEAANEWDKHGRDESYLYRGARLSEVEQVLSIDDFSSLEKEFVRASVKVRNAERRARLRRLLLQAGTAMLLLAAVGVVIWQIQSSKSPWKPLFSDDPVVALAVTNETPPTYYLGTNNIGAGRSQDGVNWTIYREGLPTDEVPVNGIAGKDVPAIKKLAVDGLNPDRVFAYVARYGIYRSEDAGETWQAANADLPDGVIIGLAAWDGLVLAVFDQTAGYGLYASRDNGVNWDLAGGQGEPPLDKVYAVQIAHGGHEVYVGTEGGLYSSSTASPWAWEEIEDLDSVMLIAPRAGDDEIFYLATATPQGNSDVYRWKPGETMEKLTTVEDVPKVLTPHPDPTASIAALELFFDGEVIAVMQDGQTKSLGQEPGYVVTLLAAPHPTEKRVWLLLGHENGLLEYQGSLN